MTIVEMIKGFFKPRIESVVYKALSRPHEYEVTVSYSIYGPRKAVFRGIDNRTRDAARAYYNMVANEMSIQKKQRSYAR